MKSHLNRLRAARGAALVKFLIFVAVLAAMLSLAWMMFLPSMLQSTVNKRTGFSVRLTQLTANPFTGKVLITGCVLKNPPGWPTSDFVDIREFKAEGDVASFFGSRAVIKEAVIDVPQVTLVTDVNGRTNLALFRERISGAASRPKDPKKKQPEPTEPKPYLIERLRLRFEKVVMVDYSKKTPVTREVVLGIDQTYENVTSAKQLVTGALPGVEAIGAVIGGLLPGRLGETMMEATRDPADLMKKAGKKAVDSAKGLLDKLEQSPKP